MPTLAEQQRARGMLVTQGWPNGYCPLHVYEGRRCHTSCVAVRREFALVAHELAIYFECSPWRWWKHNHKLIDAERLEIRRIYAESDTTQLELAQRYGVHERTIRRVLSGEAAEEIAHRHRIARDKRAERAA